MTDAGAGQKTNLLLASLPAKEQRRLLRRMEAVALRTNETLHELGRPIADVHFPLQGCVISVVRVLDDGKSFDAGPIGYEGLVGVEAFLGAAEVQFRTVVRVGGGALRMKADDLKAAVGAGGKLPEVLRSYTQFLLLLFSQVAGCNRFHSLEKHLCSWLLTVHDRIEGDVFAVTHEVLAEMIGVRRVGITQAARKLQHAGLIRYRWGKLTILDRMGLEAYACACYRQHTRAYRRLLDSSWPYR